MRVQREHHPEWIPEVWQHIQERRVQRVLAGIDHVPDRRTRASRPRRRQRPAARTLHLEEHPNTTWLIGDRIVALLDAAQIQRRQWDWQRRLWMIPTSQAETLATYAEWRERRVVTREQFDS
ncbi:hypothetical protein [Blastococcus saxobsidens]|uniref:Uncharacterized protein n=1 Tax=Blastococcus saxobsidens TaxID=138336 RepID=A0A4Q7Y2V0_9ACTN|nr:hypothetical protein [Blastococcus saxobsidens]RZU31167.1 hypothetical protein BKA19_0815 [Blastococcus saxobsidens]